MSRFVKIGQDGALLSEDATEWAAVLDTTTNLMWTAEETDAKPWKQACEVPATLSTAGFTNWRMPTVEELFCLADRTKVSPAIDKEFFPNCKSNWYWSSTVDCESPAVFAWGVDFSSGYSLWYGQYGGGFVRAVRAGQLLGNLV